MIFACDVLAYLVLMGRLGMAGAGFPIIAACPVRALFIPAIPILGCVGWRSAGVRYVSAAVLSVVFYLGVLVISIYAGSFHTVPHPKAMHHLDELPETAGQLVFQLFGAPELAIVVLFVVQAGATARILRHRRPATN